MTEIEKGLVDKGPLLQMPTSDECQIADPVVVTISMDGQDMNLAPRERR